MQNILEKLQLENNKNYLHQYCEVLIENKLENQEKYFGRTKYMSPVIFDSNNCNPGELINVKITSFNSKIIYLVSIKSTKYRLHILMKIDKQIKMAKKSQ